MKKNFVVVFLIMFTVIVFPTISEAKYLNVGNGKIDKDTSGTCKVKANSGYYGQAEIRYNGKSVKGSWVKDGNVSSAYVKGAPNSAKYANFKKNK